jgi:hypothetical protein
MLAETVDAGLLRTAAEIKNDEKILVQIRGKDCVALEVCYHKVCYSNYTKFLTREVKKQSETERSTSVYDKSYDVFCKTVIEMEVIRHKQIKYMKDLLEKFVTIARNTENVDASKYRAFKLKQRLIKSYPQLVFCVPKMRNVSEIVYVENLDSSELVEEHMSNQSEYSNVDIDEKTTIINEDDLNPTIESEETSNINELQILYNAALILCQNLQEMPKLNLPWPLLASDLTTDNVRKVVPCELFNVLAWICGFSPEATLSEYVPIEGKNSTKLTSIAQDLVNLASGGRNPTSQEHCTCHGT